MNFKPYPKAKDTPNRKTRKSQRNIVFAYNYKLRSRLNRERRAQREASAS